MLLTLFNNIFIRLADREIGGGASGPKTGHQEVGPSNWPKVGLLVSHCTESATRTSVQIADNAVPFKGREPAPLEPAPLEPAPREPAPLEPAPLDNKIAKHKLAGSKPSTCMLQT